MKKNKISVLAAILAIGSLAFTSCNKDDATGYSTLEVNNTVATIAPIAPAVTMPVTPPLVFGTTPIVVDEVNEQEFKFSVTLDIPQPVAIQIKTVQVSGTATMGEDYTVSDVFIAPYATTGTGTIKILKDDAVESVETATLQVSDITTSNAVVTSKMVTFTINNWVSPMLNLDCNFDHDFSISGVDYSLCEKGYDMDYFVLNSSLVDTDNHTGATGACVEKVRLDSTTMTDGTYYIFYDIYSDAGLNSQYHDPFNIPTTVNYMRSGAIKAGTFVQEGSFVPTSTDGSGSGYVCTVTLAAGVFTIEDSNATVIASGRAASFKNTIANSIAKARIANHK